ncbi:hypothetical protein FSPOR_4705 [Fusarium sporotrichioides]|uniref:Uncharacterized protein n=1 Tax=Fusarium sporotrichioides TaxID=5514 RepID=A0A395SB77_FUSSP|nr:hypothetical protein FSPOR_4705 [Fusarium sporotrichioides]
MADPKPELKPEFESVRQLIVENPWFCKNPLFWTAQHLDLLKIGFQRTDVILKHPQSANHYDVKEDDLMYSLAKRFAKSLTSAAKYDAFVKILDLMGTKLWHFPHEKAVFMFDTKDVHVSDCYTCHYGSPALCEVPIVGYFHYDDVKWARLKNIPPQSNPGDGGNPPMARLCHIRLRNVTPTKWSEDPYLVGLVRLLVSNEEDPMTVHVFAADIGIRLLECIYDPALSLEGVVWPIIQHSKLPIEPFNTFAERVVAELLGYRK